jgi:Flp pilus assembly protein TadG
MSLTPRPGTRGARLRHLDDRGGVSIMVAILVPALLLLAALVIDGGGQIRALQRADNIAAQAARAAGQAIDIPAAISGGAKRIDPAAATRAATAYLTRAGATGTVRVTADGQSVTVTAAIGYQSLLLGVLGQTSHTVTGHATARILDVN